MTAKLALPKREFVNGSVHYAGPFSTTVYVDREHSATRDIEHALCGAWGPDKAQLRVRRSVNCMECVRLTDWIWSHRRGQGQGEWTTSKPGKERT